MITLCWAAKGGSGTTVVTAAMALAATEPTLLVDLDGDLPAVFGLPDPDGPGVHDWLRSEADATRLTGLETSVDGRISLLPAGRAERTDQDRWSLLANWLSEQHRSVIVDAGSRTPPPALLAAADRTLLVTRACYLALRAAVRQTVRPTGVVLIEEAGRAMSPSDVEASIGAPIVVSSLNDPAIARAVDAGLLAARLPRALRRQMKLVVA
jgi:cellulose biosynthesis protein BcsQ